MKITLAFASSVNGKITKGKDSKVKHWTSPADQKHIAKLIADHQVIITGRKTYDAAKGALVHKHDTLRIVLTRHPSKYQHQEIAGQLEFTNETPQALVKRLRNTGITNALLISGSQVTSLFLKHKLVSQLILTLEPKLFGSGLPMLAPSDLNIKLNLSNVQKLNSQGTLVLRYSLSYN